MAYFDVTATNGEKAIINGNDVNKVIDDGTYRTIYQGSNTNTYQVTDTLATLLTDLKG